MYTCMFVRMLLFVSHAQLKITRDGTGQSECMLCNATRNVTHKHTKHVVQSSFSILYRAFLFFYLYLRSKREMVDWYRIYDTTVSVPSFL